MPRDAIAVSQQAVCSIDAGRDGFVRTARLECYGCRNPSGHRIFTECISIPMAPANRKLRPSRSNHVAFGPRARSNMHRPIQD